MMSGIDVYYGAASGQQRAALRRLEPEGVMISYATENNRPWDGDHKLMIDSGGYHHMMAGTGEYETSDGDYLRYIERVAPDYWALRDYPCEPDLLRDLGRSVEEQQRRTTNDHLMMLDAHRHNPPGEPMAVLQGWTLDDYLTHLDTFRDKGILGAANGPETVGIGSVCRRGYDEEIAEIVLSVRDALPSRYHLHAFGVKGSVLRFREVVEALDSVDSAAYDWAESRFPGDRSGDKMFTWRDSARGYLNWRHELENRMGATSLHGGTRQTTLIER